MLRRLSNVRRRVEQLATQAGSGRCDGNHRRHRVVNVFGDDPIPPWPERERGGRCACGAELEYFTVVHELHMEPHADQHLQGGTSCGAR